MTRRGSLVPTALHLASLTLVMLALAVRVVVPVGFMITEPGDGARFPLVICTGHGAWSAHAPPADRDTKGKFRSYGACAFSGHVAGPAPIKPPFTELIRSAAPVEAAQPLFDLIPGRGLAAPPPPSHAPPDPLI